MTDNRAFTNHLSPITYQLPAITYFRCFLMAPKANMTGKTPFVKVQGLLLRV